MSPTFRTRLVLLLFTSSLAAGGYAWKSEDNLEMARARFGHVSNHAVNQLKTHMQTFGYGLRGTRGALIGAGGQTIALERFRQYIESLKFDQEFPGALGFGFVQRVAPQDLDGYIHRLRTQETSDFALREFAPNAGERWMVQFIVPAYRNRTAIGMDIASEPARREAAENSMLTGESTLTAPITLTQEQSQPRGGCLLFLPVYRDNHLPATPEERKRSTFGWVFAPLLVKDVVASIDFRDGEFALNLSDLSSGQPEMPFFQSFPGPRPEDPLTRERRIDLYGRRWKVDVQPLAPFYEHLNLLHPGWVALRMGALGLLLSIVFYANQSWTRRRLLMAAEEALRAAFVEASPDAIIALDLEGRVTDWNQGATQMFGYSQIQASGRRLEDLLGASESELQSAWTRMRAKQSVPLFESTLQRRQGERFDVSLTLTPIRREGEAMAGCVLVAREISEQKAVQAKILQLNATLEQQVLERTEQIRTYSAWQRAILAYAGSSLIATDASGIIQHWNPSAEAMLGYRAEEVIGKVSPVIIHLQSEIVDRAAALSAELGSTVEPGLESFVAKVRLGYPDTNEWTYVRKDGTHFPVLLTITGLLGEAGELMGYVGIAVDLSERKQLETKLVALNAALEERTTHAESANQAKSAFLANTSHEIRTPMNAIIGMTYLLSQTVLNPEQSAFVGSIQDAGRHLLSILNDILDLSKIEAGQLEVESVPFHLPTVLDDIGNILSGTASRKKFELVVLVPSDVPAFVIGDPTRLRQVLTNLIGNAIKFTEEGSVVLRARKEGQTAEHALVTFSVTDTGIGIAAEALESLFNPFTQADVSTTRRFGGTGLGLAIVKRLVEMMGGELGVHSTPNVGSEFWFRLQFPLATGLDKSTPPKRNLLIAEKHVLQRDALCQAARWLQWDFTAVDSPTAMLQKLESQRFDAVLIDWSLSGEPGLSTLKAARERFLGVAARAVVLVNAWESAEARQVVHPDLDIILNKPAGPDALAKAVERVRGEIGASREPVEVAKGMGLPGVRVLVVDDSEVNVEVARRILELEGANVETAGDGLEACERLAEDSSFDIVLMDVQMPQLDGNRATEKIRKELGLAELPIVALTAGAMLSERQVSLDAGMNDFLAKPLNPQQLLTTLRSWVEKHRGAALPRVEGFDVNEISKSWPAIKGLDLKIACARSGGDRQKFLSLLAHFNEEYADLGRECRLPSTSAHLPKWIERLRQVTDLAGQVGAREVQRVGGRLLRCLRNPDALGVEDNCRALSAAIEKLRNASEGQLVKEFI